ncbi:MAG TPA: hypothetical protein ENN09_00490 [Planctomycetes bacterium]|nr:hypothetical protein [Planctomycetota bacterium]
MTDERLYLAACPHCGYSADGLVVSGICAASERIREIAVCLRCRVVLSADIPPLKSRLLEYRRQIEETVARLQGRGEMYRQSLERRVDELKDKVEAGSASPYERARYSRARSLLAEIKPQDVSFFEEKLREITRALAFASDGPFFHSCGSELVIHEDSPSGYAVPCPVCGERLVVRLRDGRSL